MDPCGKAGGPMRIGTLVLLGARKEKRMTMAQRDY